MQHSESSVCSEFEKSESDSESCNWSDDIEDFRADDTNANFVYLFESEQAKKPLYPGSPHTVLGLLTVFFAWFTAHPSVSKSALSSLLTIQHNILPKGNNFPKSYDEGLRYIKEFLLPTVTYHACPDDHILFLKTSRYDYSSLTACPVCGKSRYKNAERKTPSRKFVYYPLGPRWKRIFGDSIVKDNARTCCACFI